MIDPLPGTWLETGTISRRSYICGHCGTRAAPDQGYRCESETFPQGVVDAAYVVICPGCIRPTYLSDSTFEQVPGPFVGRAVEGLPEEVEGLYTEARRAVASGAPTAAVMAARVLLMYIAVQQGAPPDGRFVEYVRYLVDQNVVGKTAEPLLEQIRKQGNRANHEIEQATSDDAQIILKLVEHVLSAIYELATSVVNEDDRAD